MTCLYCGKKLGFFSRYKDTPFCSEEHLRTHQDVLERALMERLGSKAKTPAKPLKDLAEAEPPAVRSMFGLESSLRTPEPTPPPPVATPAAPPAPEPPPAPLKADPPRPSAPAPMNEDFLVELPHPAAALEPEKPLIPASAYAIIVQADCCTPQLPPAPAPFSLPFEPDEFPIESAFNPVSTTAPAPPQPYTDQLFEDRKLKLPVSAPVPPSADSLEYPLGELVALEYDASLTPLAYSALGHRDAIAPRPRLRYPYAASQVSSTWNLLPVTEDTLPFTASDEWAPVLPAAQHTLEPGAALLADSHPSPVQELPLSIAALTGYSLAPASEENFGDSLAVYARTLSDRSGLGGSFSNGDWAPHIARPHAATQVLQHTRLLKTRHANRVPPIPFPSLFQLGPVLPPRPESTVS